MLFASLVQTIAESQSVADWRALDAAWLDDDEKQLFKKIEAHVMRYRSFPDAKALSLIGWKAPAQEAGNPTKYYLHELANRAAWRVAKDRIQPFTETIKSRDVDGMRRIIEGLALEVRRTSPEAETTYFHDSVDSLWDEYIAAKGRVGLSGFATGFPTMDVSTGGLQAGDLFVIAGRPNVGKSYILIRMAAEAFRRGVPFNFVTLEMMVPQVQRRFLGMMTGVNPSKMREGKVSKFGEEKMKKMLDRVRGSSRMGFNPGNMKKGVGAIEAVLEKDRPDIMFIDAAYLLRSVGRRREKHHEELKDVIGELAAMAKAYARPIVISVQLNRGFVPKRPTAKAMSGSPDLAHLAGSDSIGQDASVVYGLTKWNPDDDNYTEQEIGSRRTMHHLKNRDGEMDSFDLDFQFDPVRVEELGDEPERETATDSEPPPRQEKEEIDDCPF